MAGEFIQMQECLSIIVDAYNDEKLNAAYTNATLGTLRPLAYYKEKYGIDPEQLDIKCYNIEDSLDKSTPLKFYIESDVLAFKVTEEKG